MTDRYLSFDALARHELAGRDYRMTRIERPAAQTLVIAPHGGTIEPGSGEIARLIAAHDHNLYLFEGLPGGGDPRRLHITSHRFDEPTCRELLTRAAIVVTVHGCLAPSRICLGGLDTELMGRVAAELSGDRLPATISGHEFPGTHRDNICNRGLRKAGVQIEISGDLRREPFRQTIAGAVRRALAGQQASVRDR